MMTPNVETSLSLLAQVMGQEMAPNIDDQYLGALSALISGLLIMASQEHDRAADNLIKENGALRKYLEKHRTMLGDAKLEESIRRALEQDAPDFRISSLTAENQSLKEVFVSVHETVETLDADWARAAEDEAWAIIREAHRAAPVENVLDLFDSPG